MNAFFIKSRVGLCTLALMGLVMGSACSTVIKPTRPSLKINQGDSTSGFRFEGANITVRQPGLPLTNSVAWQTDVENFTARTLNQMLDTDPDAQEADTMVSFDLPSRSVIQIGTWKEMTISLTTRLPDGRRIRSDPITQNIDSAWEYAGSTAVGVTGSALDVTAAIASLYWVLTSDSRAGYIFLGSLVGGLCLNFSQSGITYLVAQREETRWSNLYVEALEQHGQDIRKALGQPYIPKQAPQTPVVIPPAPPTPPSQPPREVISPSDPDAPPAPLDPDEFLY